MQEKTEQVRSRAMEVTDEMAELPLSLNSIALLLATLKSASAFQAPVPQRPFDRRASNVGMVDGFGLGAKLPREELERVAKEGTDARKMLDAAKDEEASIFEEDTAEAAVYARSEEAIAANRALADAAVAELRDNAEVVEALQSRKGVVDSEIAESLTKPKGTLAIIGNGMEVGEISLGGYDLEDPKYISSQFREGAAAVLMVNKLYARSFGPDALKLSVAEQETMRGEFPGPMPVVANMPVTDPLQFAQVALEGAKGVVLSLAIAGKDKASELWSAAQDLGLETIVRVTSAEELDTAIGLGAKIIAFGDMSLGEAQVLLPKVPEGTVTVADFPYLEVRGAWKVRDAGFNALVTGESLLRMVARDRCPPAAVCKSMLAKGSVAFGLGLQLGRNEGAKEQYGELLM